MAKSPTKKQLLSALEQICVMRERSLLEAFAYQGPPSRRHLNLIRKDRRDKYDEGYNAALAQVQKIARDVLGLNQ